MLDCAHEGLALHAGKSSWGEGKFCYFYVGHSECNSSYLFPDTKSTITLLNRTNSQLHSTVFQQSPL